MAFPLSPGINVSEIDLSTVIPSAASSIGAFAGAFQWGPANEINLVTSEDNLKKYFGLPNDDNYEYWFTAANFLAYSNNLKLVRAANSASTFNATANGNGVLIDNSVVYEDSYASGANTYGSFAARYAGKLGNSITVSICPNANAFSQNLSSGYALTTNSSIIADSNTSVLVSGSNLTNYVKVGDLVALANGATQTNYVSVTGVAATYINVASAFNATIPTGSSILRRWKYYGQFSNQPSTSDFASKKSGSNDEMHIVVIDTDGNFGEPGNILEKYAFVSKASDAEIADKSSNYYKAVINQNSKYIWWMCHPESIANTTVWGSTAANTTFTETASANATNYYVKLSGGADGTVADADLINAYDKFNNLETADISLMMAGPANSTVISNLKDIVEGRKDCLLFVSPRKADVVNNSGSEATDIISYRNSSLPDSSFLVMDSGWKYQFDKYRKNDTPYRWVPLNGDIAGICARTDKERDPWYSPAGLTRGQVKNIIKLAWNPTAAERDDLYLKGVNPVVSFPGEGFMLYGDKTMQSRPSAFDRINVRRLFIVLEKAISKAARSTLFEFNDQFTRAQFRNLVEPYLRDVQGRRGITDFRVVCDETNNTPEVLDRNEFVGDIYIKPARSVNFIQLNFVAVRTDVNFDEIVGKY